MDEIIKEFNDEDFPLTDWDAIDRVIQEECEKAQSKLKTDRIVFDVSENILKRLREEA